MNKILKDLKQENTDSGAGESITAGNSFRSFLSTLGQLLLSLEAFRNVETKVLYRVESLQEEICSGNRIGTLEQIQGSVEVFEKQIEKSDRNLRR